MGMSTRLAALPQLERLSSKTFQGQRQEVYAITYFFYMWSLAVMDYCALGRTQGHNSPVAHHSRVSEAVDIPMQTWSG